MPTKSAAVMSDPVDSPQLSIRMHGGEIVRLPAWQLSTSLMAESKPLRTFRWYKGQPHYSGTYWSSTEETHVIYESRLELTRLLLADFDPAISRIFAQPLMIRAKVDGRFRQHTPDYLLIAGGELRFVAVKPQRRLEDPNVIATFAWVRKVVESNGWTFEVASEPPQPYFDNVRFLAGYRRKWAISEPALARLRARGLDGMSIREALHVAGGSEPLIRAALLHMLWTHELEADLSEVLSDRTILTHRELS
jgi:hypothetical protein